MPGNRPISEIFALSFALLSIAGSSTAADGPPLAAARRIQGHSKAASKVLFSPDGSLLATAGFDGAVKVWRASDGSEIAAFSGHTGKVLSLAFGPDGETLLSGGEDRTLKLWALQGPKPEKLFGHRAKVRALLAAGGDRLVSGGDDGTLRIWDRASRKEELLIRGLPAPPVLLSGSADGTRLAAALLDGTLRIFLLSAPPPKATGKGEPLELIRKGEAWRYFKGSAAPPAGWEKPGFDESRWGSGESGFGYSADPGELAHVKTRLDDMKDRYLTLYLRKTFQIADPGAIEGLSLAILSDDGFVAYLNGAEVGRSNVDGSPPGHETAAKGSIEAKEIALDLGPHLSKLAAGENTIALQGHNGSKSSSDFLLAAALQAVLKPEKSEEAAPPRPGSEIGRIEGSGVAVQALALSPGGDRIAWADAGGTIRIHPAAGGAESARFDGPGAVRGMVYLPEEMLLVSRADGSIRTLSIAEKKAVKGIAEPGGAVTAFAAKPDGKLLVTAGEDGTFRLRELPEGKELRSFLVPGSAISCLAVSPDGKTIAAGSAGGALLVLSAETGKTIARYSQDGEVRALASNSDGRFVLTAAGNDILEWRNEAGGALKSFRNHGGVVFSAAFSPGGKEAASASADRTVRIWSIAEGRELRSIDAHSGGAFCVAWSPDGKAIASGGFDGLVKLWKAEDGSLLRNFEGHEEGVFALAFTADGRSLLSGSSDRSIRKWDIREGKAAGVFRGHAAWVSDLEVLEKEAAAASIDYGGNLMIWDLNTLTPLFSARIPSIIHSLALSPDGRRLAVSSQDGSCSLFEIPAIRR